MQNHWYAALINHLYHFGFILLNVPYSDLKRLKRENFHHQHLCRWNPEGEKQIRSMGSRAASLRLFMLAVTKQGFKTSLINLVTNTAYWA